VNTRAQQLLDELLELSVEDRALIAAELEGSLDEQGLSFEAVETALNKELERRIDDVVEGRVETRDVDEVLSDLRARYPRR
jgi:putative addiction module component (TIGR02574 family)